MLAQLPHGTESYVIVGAPLLAGVCLLVLPLIFNRGQRAPSRRPWAVASIVLIVMSVGVLWYARRACAMVAGFRRQAIDASVVVHAASPDILHGADLFHAKGCEYCHAIAGNGGHRGPDLTSVADRLNRPTDHASHSEWRLQHAGLCEQS